MVIAGIILLILGVCGVLRIVTLPLGCLLVILGLVWDIVHFVGHTVALIF